MITLEELEKIYNQPLPELMFQAGKIQREKGKANEIQRCALLSIKTGNCPEDCKYCSQSAHYDTEVKSEALLDLATVRQKAEQAKAEGATRFCMGAAWRGPKDNASFDQVLEMVKMVRGLGMEACVTLGMLTEQQAQRLAEAGLSAYNHNLDTSREFYPQIVSTRTYDDRLQTLKYVSKAGIPICCGGILGMGESVADRLKLLQELSQLDVPPESIPINCLMPARGTPLALAAPVDSIELVRLIATTRIVFPTSRVRLSAGRENMSTELQVLCFLAGADSIFFGTKLLTAGNPSVDRDLALFESMGLTVHSALAVS